MAAPAPPEEAGVTMRRVVFDERFYAALLPETAQDRLEAQELRQLVHRALLELSPEEVRVVELRFQHKKSPGQVAAQLGLPRPQLRAIERQALQKLGERLRGWR